MRTVARTGVRFLAVGALSTVIEIAVFNALLLGADWSPVPSKIVGSVVALVTAYAGNRYWAFSASARRRGLSQIGLFLLVNAGCAALGAGIVGLGVRISGMADSVTVNLINAFSIGVIVVIRFALYRYVVFGVTASVLRQHSGSAPPAATEVTDG